MRGLFIYLSNVSWQDSIVIRDVAKCVLELLVGMGWLDLGSGCSALGVTNLRREPYMD